MTFWKQSIYFSWYSKNVFCCSQLQASQVALVIKNLPANAGDIRDVGLIPGLGRFPGGGLGNPLNILAWRIPGTEEPGGLQSIRLCRVGHNWNDLACTHNCILSLEVLLASTCNNLGQLFCSHVIDCKKIFIRFSRSFRWDYNNKKKCECMWQSLKIKFYARSSHRSLFSGNIHFCNPIAKFIIHFP